MEKLVKVMDNAIDKLLLTKALYAIEKTETLFDGHEEKEADEMYDLLMKLPKLIEELQHHKDTTLGLWATDRPDLIEDPKKIMFEIK